MLICTCTLYYPDFGTKYAQLVIQGLGLSYLASGCEIHIAVYIIYKFAFFGIMGIVILLTCNHTQKCQRDYCEHDIAYRWCEILCLFLMRGCGWPRVQLGWTETGLLGWEIWDLPPWCRASRGSAQYQSQSFCQFTAFETDLQCSSPEFLHERYIHKDEIGIYYIMGSTFSFPCHLGSHIPYSVCYLLGGGKERQKEKKIFDLLNLFLTCTLYWNTHACHHYNSVLKHQSKYISQIQYDVWFLHL